MLKRLWVWHMQHMWPNQLMLERYFSCFILSLEWPSFCEITQLFWLWKTEETLFILISGKRKKAWSPDFIRYMDFWGFFPVHCSEMVRWLLLLLLPFAFAHLFILEVRSLWGLQYWQRQTVEGRSLWVSLLFRSWLQGGIFYPSLPLSGRLFRHHCWDRRHYF